MTTLCKFYFNCTNPINCDDCESQQPPAPMHQIEIEGCWYTIEELGPNEYRAEVMGQGARGRTPEEAIANAARKSEPQHIEEDEEE